MSAHKRKTSRTRKIIAATGALALVVAGLTIAVSATNGGSKAGAALGTGGTCTSPTTTLTGASDTVNIDGGVENYWVNNDAWSGSHGPQTVGVCSQQSWVASSNQSNNGGQIETYPDTEYDVGGRDSQSTTPISSWPAGSITSTFAESNPTDGGWDAAYDLWTNNWSNETMIWNQWQGDNSYWALCANSTNSKSYCGVGQQGVAVTLAGVPYHFLANGPNNTPCTTANEGSCELMFFRDTQVSSGTVDLSAAFQWEVANGYAKASDVPTQLEYGTEIAYTNGTENFNTTGLTFTLNGVTPPPTTTTTVPATTTTTTPATTTTTKPVTTTTTTVPATTTTTTVPVTTTTVSKGTKETVTCVGTYTPPAKAPASFNCTVKP